MRLSSILSGIFLLLSVSQAYAMKRTFEEPKHETATGTRDIIPYDNSLHLRFIACAALGNALQQGQKKCDINQLSEEVAFAILSDLRKKWAEIPSQDRERISKDFISANINITSESVSPAKFFMTLAFFHICKSKFQFNIDVPNAIYRMHYYYRTPGHSLMDSSANLLNEIKFDLNNGYNADFKIKELVARKEFDGLINLLRQIYYSRTDPIFDALCEKDTLADLERSETDIEPFLRDALRFMQIKGKYAQCVHVWSTLNTRNPDTYDKGNNIENGEEVPNAEMLIMVEVYITLENFAEAAKLFEVLFRDAPEKSLSAESYYNGACAQAKNNNYPRACQLRSQFTKMEPVDQTMISILDNVMANAFQNWVDDLD